MLIDSARHLALLLRDERLGQGWSQRDLSEACLMQQSTVSDMETGDVASVTVSVALRLAAALGLRLALVPFTKDDHAAAEEVADADS